MNPEIENLLPEAVNGIYKRFDPISDGTKYSYSEEYAKIRLDMPEGHFITNVQLVDGKVQEQVTKTFLEIARVHDKDLTLETIFPRLNIGPPRPTVYYNEETLSNWGLVGMYLSPKEKK